MKILIADDDKLSIELLSEYLKESGHTIIKTFDGEEMIKTALNEKPDLILTDIHMPKMKGDTTIAMMENYPELQNVPVIVVTATPENEIYSLGLPFEVPVVLKPIDFPKLAAEIKKIESRKK
jgi:CheY-like chemotaxis protein